MTTSKQAGGDPQTSENCDLPPEDLASKQMFILLCVYNKQKN